MTHSEEIKSIKYESIMDKIKKDAERIARPHAECLLTANRPKDSDYCTCGRDEEVQMIVDAMYAWYRTGYKHGDSDALAEAFVNA